MQPEPRLEDVLDCPGRKARQKAAVASVLGHVPQASVHSSSHDSVAREAALAVVTWSRRPRNMSVASYISPKARKGVVSPIQGRGLVAIEPIARGEIVAIKGGHIIDSRTLAEHPETAGNSEIQITENFHIAALEADEYEDVMLFLNHSCEPNVGVAGNIVFVAMRDVASGEELTTDYALFDDQDWEMECRCGRPSCRGVISGRDWRRPELQSRYGPYFSWYLQQKIQAVRPP